MKRQSAYTRFSVGQRVEHALLIISFTLLGLTGLPQRYAGSPWAETLIAWMGGVETVRWLHHTAAVMLILESAFHAVALGYRVYVQGARMVTMLPAWKDIQDFFAAVGHNLGLRRARPLFDRYSFDEKLEYWAVVWGTLIMILTGFMLWNPIATTRWLPGEIIPAAKAAHGGEALLAVLAIITWHVYNVHIKHFNKSIFTGRQTREEMLEDHPLELARIEGGLEQPAPASLAQRRRRVYVPVAGLTSLVVLLGVYWFVTLEVTAITTIPPEPTQVVFQHALPEVTPSPQQIAAPPVPHMLSEHEHCRRCHAAGTIRPFPEDHASYGNELCLGCHVVGPEAAQSALTGAEALSFSTDIEPALKANCVVCHGVAGGLNLSSYIWIMAGGNAGPAVVPGQPEQSLIVQVLEAGHFADLPASTKADLREWILAGAPDN
ncbi:MAG: c-type cytochrome domain-containing protein [Anaerolineae bacterium]